LIAVAALALVTTAAILLNRPAPAAANYPREVALAEGVALREEGAFVLDVRQPEEWVEYHVPGSTLIPLDQLESRLAEVPRDREVLVVCRSGNRSATGRDILLQAGFSEVTSLAGGLSQWKAAGHPTVSGP
jgi:rhodanese-related sulfurtransferase